MMPDQIEYAALDELFLDPRNPRLGLRNAYDELPQEDILNRLRSWSLEELAVSFLESGFWPQEALICVVEETYGEDRLIVVEGNRRLAALKLLKQSYEGHPPSQSWSRMVQESEPPGDLFTRIPFLRMSERSEVDVFLGYRHVTGIKEWAPAEKAEYIAFLVDDRGLTFGEVMRKIGSKTEAVRRNYAAFRILNQMAQTEDVDTERVEQKFSVLFLALRTHGVQRFLGLDLADIGEGTESPIDQDHLDNLREFSLWLFGNGDADPVVSDSRQVDRFSHVLGSDEALRYLRASKRPNIDYAYQLAGGAEAEITELIEAAAFNVEQAFSTIHLHLESERLQKASRRLILDLERLKGLFPEEGKR